MRKAACARKSLKNAERFILDTDLSHAERLELDELAHKFAHTAKTTPGNVCPERKTLFSRRIAHVVVGVVGMSLCNAQCQKHIK